MMRMMTVVFIFASIFGGSAAVQEPAQKAMFCPACWKFLEPSDLDVLGRCAVSLKEPVEVKAATLTWLWCRSHQAWHRRPCHGDTALSVESTALLVPDGSEPMTARAY